MGVQFSLLFGANDGCPILILGTAMDWSEKMDVLICQFGTAMELVGKNGCPHLSILSFGQPLIWGECGCPLPHNSGQPSQFGTAINLGRIWVSSFSRLSFPPVTRPHQRPRRVARAEARVHNGLGMCPSRTAATETGRGTSCDLDIQWLSTIFKSGQPSIGVDDECPDRPVP